jgi:hypothetical protein
MSYPTLQEVIALDNLKMDNVNMAQAKIEDVEIDLITNPKHLGIFGIKTSKDKIVSVSEFMGEK